jgi:hypothetical protein
MLTPLFDGILFIFVDDLKKGFFQKTTKWGFQLRGTSDDSAKNGRWGKVVAVGPDVPAEEVENGTFIFIEPLMWTKGVKHDEVEVWKTDATKVMAVSDDYPED